VLREALHYVAAHGPEIVQLLAACAEPPPQVAIRYALEAVPDTQVEVLTRAPYTLQGAPVSVQVPHFAHFVPTARVQRPWGYAMPAAVAEHLRGHGLQVAPVPPGTRLQLEVPTFIAPCAEPGPKILEAQASTYWRARHARTERALPEGWCVVPSGQPHGAIAVYACEAESDDGLVANGILPPPVAGEEMAVWRVLQAP